MTEIHATHSDGRSTPVRLEVVGRSIDFQGELPIWDVRDKALYWIDTRRPCIQRLAADGTLTTWMMPVPIGSIALCRDGGILAAMQTGLHRVDTASGTAVLKVDPEPHHPFNRMNDGKCDRRGRFWCGTRNSDEHGGPGKLPTGSIYRFDRDYSAHAVDSGFIVPNGMAFSPDDRTMLLADSAREALYAYDFDLDAGSVSNRRLFFSTRDMPGRVDGATFDSEGYYWCTLINDWSIARLDPLGRIEQTIRLPVKRPTMCSFGGPDLDVLFVTTSSINLTPEEKEAQPLAGRLLAIHGLGARGIPEPTFNGTA